MTRDEKDVKNMNIAISVAERGKCLRQFVGCIITQEGRIISSGYNGPIQPMERCELLGCDVSEPCQHSMHAEANAISFAARLGISLKGSKLYCTHGPCKSCAGLMVQAGIKEVIYHYEYRDEGGKLILLKNKVLLRKV